MTSDRFYSTSFRGIGVVTQQELGGMFPGRVRGIQSLHTADYDLTLFSFSGRVKDLAGLGTTEDVFFTLSKQPLAGTKKDLAKLESAVLRSPVLERGLFCHRQFSGYRPSPRTTFRVIAQAADVPWRSYRRVDMQKAIERGVKRRYGKWKLVEDHAQLEFWIQQAGGAAVTGIRLSDRSMRHRTDKVANIPGSLRPSIAHAMVYLSGVEDDDVFLDPMCGAGTILLERARAGRYKLLLGGDIEETAVQATLENMGSRHEPRKITRWDATKLPLADASVSKIVVNPPWGRKVGTAEHNQELYGSFLREASRVLETGGRLVILTGEWELFKRVLRTVPTMVLGRCFKNISVLGWHADLFVCEKC